MLLKYKSKTEIPEGMEEFFVQRGEEWVHKDLEDTSSIKKKVENFRENNIALQQTLDTMKSEMAKFKDLDPAKYAEMAEKLESIQEKKLIDEGEFNKLLEQRTTKMKVDYEAQLDIFRKTSETAVDRAEKHKKELSKLKVDTAIASAISEVAIPRKGAMSDIMARANRTFGIDDEGVITATKDGKALFNKEGAPLSMTDWAAEQFEEAPFLFEPTSGGDAQGGEVKHSGSVIRKGQIDGKSLHGDTISAIASGDVTVVD